MNIRTIEVVDYDSTWQQAFEMEKRLLEDAIGVNAIRIEHIGSTSVIGLCAKPVIDILIAVSSLAELDDADKKLKVLGYKAKGENGIAGRRYFQKGGNQRSHHVHAFETNDPNIVRHLAFKEYLIAYPEVASKYDALKRKAALECNNNASIYMELKNDFIHQHEKLALRWYGQ